MKTLSLELQELRAKAIVELDSQIAYLEEYQSDIDYHRACATAWAYKTLGLISSRELEDYKDKFVLASLKKKGD